MSRKNKKNVPEAVEEKNDDFLAQEAKEMEEQAPEYTLDIPEDEIWTYQIEGLQAPKIGQSYDGARGKKIAVVLILLIAISLSIFFSVRALRTNEYKYNQLEDGTYELVLYTNPGSVRNITVDYVDGDPSKPITSLHEYAFNCDGAVEHITIGKDVKNIDGKTFYSCWNLQTVEIDDENPYYCDVEGVVYNKDMTELIYYPCDYDRTLRLKEGYAHLVWECESCGRQYDPAKGDAEGGLAPGTLPEDFPDDYKCPGNDGKLCNSRGNEYYWAYHSDLQDDNGNEMWELWGTTEKYDEAFFKEYNLKTRTYVVPSTVTTIGQLAFAYANVTDLYIPEGVTAIGPQAIFKDEELRNIYSYKSDAPVTDTFYTAIPSLGTVYDSLPEGLETIGSDAFYHLRRLDYMYIPSSVKTIGHHLMWEAIYKDEDTKELTGITEVNVAASEEEFKANTETGESWLPEYNNGLFSKKVPVNYGAERREHVEQ